jgi:hypothetical protein
MLKEFIFMKNMVVMGGFFTVLIIACVLGGINELLGSAVLLGYIIYQILN